MKRRILCFGDSLTWGYDPVARNRQDEETRWPCALGKLLGEDFTIIEEGQCGRTIASDDPAEGEKNGLRYIIPCLESHSPLDLLIVMLGTNDLKQKFSYAAMDIAGEMQIFIEKVMAHVHFRMADSMQILLISPPVIMDVKDSWLADSFNFARAVKVSAALSAQYKLLSERYGCYFLDAAEYARVSDADGVHLDSESQKALAKAVYELISKEIYKR